MCIAGLNNEDLEEVEIRAHRIEIWLVLTKAILTISLQFSAEARSAVTDAEIHRLEQVESTLLRSLLNEQFKTANIVHYLEINKRLNPLKRGLK